MSDTITLNKGGTGERTVAIDDARVPDLFHIALNVREAACGQRFTLRPEAADLILETWHLAHDLLRRLREAEGKK